MGFEAFRVALVFAALILAGYLALSVLVRQETRRVQGLIYTALALKMAASFARYWVATGLYGGVADATAYHSAGSALAAQMVQGAWPDSLPRIPGTGFIELLTGLLYCVTGPSLLAGFVAFSWLGFWGLFLFFRAFAVAFPDADRFRYGCLVLLLPSMLFWPSSVGKESWMVLAIGAASYGAAATYARRRGGLAWMSVGLLAASMVRPHVALILVIAVASGYVLRSGRSARGGSLGKVVLLLVLISAGAIILSQAREFVGVAPDQGAGGFVEALEERGELTAQGGSSFGGVVVTNPLTFPVGFVTVLFRPFPFEAGNVQTLATSLEGVVLLGLFVSLRRRILALPGLLLRHPFVAYCCTYTLLFVVAFSSFNNFGILTRQRVQVFPLALAVLAVLWVRQPRRSGVDVAAASGGGSTSGSIPRRGRPRSKEPASPPGW